MKITIYILIAVFLANSMTAFGETLKVGLKKDMIDAEAAAKPANEVLPAAN